MNNLVHKNNNSKVCSVCQRNLSHDEFVPASVIRPAVAALIRNNHPGWNSHSFICLSDLTKFREEYIKQALENEKGDISVLEKGVLKSMKKHELMSKDISSQFYKKPTFGEKLSDKGGEFGGSWKFIILFGSVIFVWILINAIAFFSSPFAPSPFILLNLVLSCLAALQAPIIMMSQNRLESRDRMRGEYDYKVNLKAELEVRQLHEKLDHLLSHQWQRLLEIQQIQTDIMNEIREKGKRKK